MLPPFTFDHFPLSSPEGVEQYHPPQLRACRSPGCFVVVGALVFFLFSRFYTTRLCVACTSNSYYDSSYRRKTKIQTQ